MKVTINLYIHTICSLSHTELSLSNLNYSSRPDRLRPIADRFNLDQDAMLENVLYVRAYTSTFPMINSLLIYSSYLRLQASYWRPCGPVIGLFTQFQNEMTFVLILSDLQASLCRCSDQLLALWTILSLKIR